VRLSYFLKEQEEPSSWFKYRPWKNRLQLICGTLSSVIKNVDTEWLLGPIEEQKMSRGDAWVLYVKKSNSNFVQHDYRNLSYRPCIVTWRWDNLLKLSHAIKWNAMPHKCKNSDVSVKVANEKETFQKPSIVYFLSL